MTNKIGTFILFMYIRIITWISQSHKNNGSPNQVTIQMELENAVLQPGIRRQK